MYFLIRQHSQFLTIAATGQQKIRMNNTASFSDTL